MKQTEEQTGLSYDTLKFYCNEGLIPNVKRDKNNRRIFSERNIAWIKSLSCLKNCGLSIAEMREYVKLCQQGPISIPARQIMLAEKRLALKRQIDTLSESIEYIDWKQRFYQDVLDGKIEYYSNLTVNNEGDETDGV